MMLPTLISVSVAPVSYFFWARAALEQASAVATTADVMAVLRVKAGISFLPVDCWCEIVCRGFSAKACVAIEYLCLALSNKKPPRRRRWGLVIWSRWCHADKPSSPGLTGRPRTPEHRC